MVTLWEKLESDGEETNQGNCRTSWNEKAEQRTGDCAHFYSLRFFFFGILAKCPIQGKGKIYERGFADLIPIPTLFPPLKPRS